MTTITNQDDIIDSRDIIEWIEYLQDTIDEAKEESPPGFTPDVTDEKQELETLTKLAEQASSAPDWEYGEQLIRDSYFTDYTEELIHECYYDTEPNTDQWPWRHLEMDWQGAADELKQDYINIDFDGVTYWIRG